MTAPKPSQWEAIADASRHTLVVAGAGTGKTFTVVHRILYVLGVPVNGQRCNDPVSLDQVAAITFTNQAARELREDLRRALRAVGRREDAYRIDEARIGTIHGFCTELLREHALRRGAVPSTRVLEEGEAVASAMQAARDALIEALGETVTPGLAALLGMWDTAKVDRWIVSLMNRPDLIETARNGANELDERERALAGLAQRALQLHEARLARGGAVDFDRMILWTRDLLRDDPLARHALQRRLRLLIIDEFQDVDPVQKQIAYAIAEPGTSRDTPRLMLVGDPKQSIYRFRRADVTVWNEVEREFESMDGCAVHALVENFRSRPAILGFVDATAGRWLDAPLADDGGPLDDCEVSYRSVTAVRDAGTVERPVELIVTPANEKGKAQSVYAVRAAEAEAIARRAQELHTDGFRWRDMALLLPAWADEPTYTSSLRAAGVPVYVLRDEGFHEQREIVDLIVALRAIRDPLDDVALFGFLRGPFVGLKDETLLRIAKDRWPPYWRSMGAIVVPDEAENDRLSRASQLIWRCLLLRDRVDPADLLESLMLETGFLAHHALRGEEGRQAIANIQHFLGVIRDMQHTGIGDLLRTIRESREREDRVAQARLFGAGEDVMLITSIHVSKGLEWPVVFWANLSAGKRSLGEDLLLGRSTFRLGTPEAAADEAEDWKALRQRLLKESDAERKRLWYVAATRARDRLIVSGIACGQSGDTPGAGILKLLPAVAESGTTRFNYTGADGMAYEGEVRWAPVAASNDDHAGPDEVAQEDRAAAVDRDGFAEAERLDVVPQAMHTAVGLTRHSATEFLAHARCPRKHWFRYTLGIREPEMEATREQLISAVARGQIVHDVLERYEAELELDSLLEDAIGRWDESAPLPTDDRGVLYRRHLTDEVTRVLDHPDYAGMVGRPGARRELPFLRVLPGGTAVQGFIDLAVPSASGSGIELLDVKTTQCDAVAARRKAAQYRPQRDAYVAAASAISAVPVTRFAFQFSHAPVHIATDLTDQDVARASASIDDLVHSIERGENTVTRFPAECGYCGYRRVGLCPGAGGPPEETDDGSAIVNRTLPDSAAALRRLARDRFRASFRLGPKERDELERKGNATIRQHARAFVDSRLAPASPANDGAQTPWRGHPVFIAQHATATCCRGCLHRWHAIAKGRELDDRERDYIVDIIMAWLHGAGAAHSDDASKRVGPAPASPTDQLELL